MFLQGGILFVIVEIQEIIKKFPISLVLNFKPFIQAWYLTVPVLVCLKYLLAAKQCLHVMHVYAEYYFVGSYLQVMWKARS